MMNGKQLIRLSGHSLGGDWGMQKVVDWHSGKKAIVHFVFPKHEHEG
jgi:hypothetical protein